MTDNDEGIGQRPGFDLLQIRWFRAICLSPLILYVIQAAVLALFVWLALPMAVIISAGYMAKGLAKAMSWGG